MNSNLSIEEVVLINNLLYIENLGGPKGTFMSPSQESKTIGDYVRGVFRNFDLIEDKTEYSNGVTGAEYKQILGAIKKNQHLQNMIIMQVHFESDSAGGGRSLFLCDPANNEAIVVFKGTQSDAEWIDNVAGLYQVPTTFQENALKWFQSLPLDDYDIITLDGMDFYKVDDTVYRTTLVEGKPYLEVLGQMYGKMAQKYNYDSNGVTYSNLY